VQARFHGRRRERPGAVDYGGGGSRGLWRGFDGGRGDLLAEEVNYHSIGSGTSRSLGRRRSSHREKRSSNVFAGGPGNHDGQWHSFFLVRQRFGSSARLKRGGNSGGSATTQASPITTRKGTDVCILLAPSTALRNEKRRVDSVTHPGRFGRGVMSWRARLE